MHPRFPFPSYPTGWYVVLFSPELARGDVRTVTYFGQDIVLFRTESGVASAVDKTCPHLGAHLGGGRVVGECLRCPFHNWAFDVHGTCVDVPYAPKIPAKARVRAWDVDERDGLVFVFYSHDGSEPTWRLPELEWGGWTANRTIRWEVASHPQEVGENTVDCSHLLPVHHVTRTDIASVEQTGHKMRVVLNLLATGAAIQMPEEVNEVELDVTLHGLGQIVSRTHVVTAGLRTRQRIHPTPIGPDSIAIFAVANTWEMPDPDYTAEIDQIFWDAFVEDFAKDFPIWGNKVWLEKPLLAGGDGPIGRYRKWCRQFYAWPESVSASTEPVPEPASLGRSPRIPSPLQAFATRLAGLADRFGGVPAVFAPITSRLGDLAGIRTSTPPQTRVEEELDAHLADGPVRPAAEPLSIPKQATRFDSVQSYFDGLEQRFDSRAGAQVDAVFQWVLRGDPDQLHFAEVRRGAIRQGTGRHASPTITVEMSEADYLLMINGELNGARAFSTGRGKLKGPVTLAMKMQRLFPIAGVNAGG